MSWSLIRCLNIVIGRIFGSIHIFDKNMSISKKKFVKILFLIFLYFIGLFLVNWFKVCIEILSLIFVLIYKTLFQAGRGKRFFLGGINMCSFLFLMHKPDNLSRLFHLTFLKRMNHLHWLEYHIVRKMKSFQIFY